MPFERLRIIIGNVGLGEGFALPVGVPVPWPIAIPPTGWLKCNGAAFTAAQYPRLAQVYPTLILPDLRGEFIRGWDDGRGVDLGRIILSNQLHMLASHSHTLASWPSSGNPASHGGAQDANGGNGEAYQSNSPILPSGGTETRPRNVAFNYIVRAA